MNRSRFIQGLKGDIQLSVKRKETNHSKESSKVFLEDEMYGSNGGIRRASATD